METTSQNTPAEEEEEEVEADNSMSLLPVIIIPTDQAWVVVLVALCQNFLLENVPLTMLSLASNIQSDDTVTAIDKYSTAAVFFGLSSILSMFSIIYSFKDITLQAHFTLMDDRIFIKTLRNITIFCLDSDLRLIKTFN